MYRILNSKQSVSVSSLPYTHQAVATLTSAHFNLRIKWYEKNCVLLLPNWWFIYMSSLVLNSFKTHSFSLLYSYENAPSVIYLGRSKTIVHENIRSSHNMIAYLQPTNNTTSCIKTCTWYSPMLTQFRSGSFP